MRSVFIAIAFMIAAAGMNAQTADDSQVPVVDPGNGEHGLPFDAIPLFDGKSMSGWLTGDGQPAGCAVTRAVMTCTTGVGNIFTEERFRSAQIHLEFKVPYMPDQHDQARGNSGVYIHGRYEIQILDSYENPTYAVGMAGALYGQTPPLVNAARPPGEWQTYDIVFHAPKCGDGGELLQPATVTLLWNRVLALDHVTVNESERACAQDKANNAGPLMLQDHGGPETRMQFRNIWYRAIAE